MLTSIERAVHDTLIEVCRGGFSHHSRKITYKELWECHSDSEKPGEEVALTARLFTGLMYGGISRNGEYAENKAISRWVASSSVNFNIRDLYDTP